MSVSPNRTRGGGGTVLGLGTVGLGESFGRATDKQIEEEGMRAYWSNWQRTKLEWDKADEGRSRRIVEELPMDRMRRAAEHSRHREMTILKMQEERRQNEAARKREAEAEAEEQRRVNKLVTDAVKKEREDGIQQRRETREREIADLQRERELLLAVSAMDREADAEAKRAHIEKMRRWHQECKERAKEDAERRLEDRKANVASIKRGQEKRDAAAKETRSGILKAKSGIVGMIAADHGKGRIAVAKTNLAKTRQGDEMRALVARERVVATQREESFLDEKSKMVRELQERTRAARQQYEDEQRARKDELQRQVAKKKEAARRLMAAEEAERAEERSVHIANVRALVNRRRTESRADTVSTGGGRSRGRRTASPNDAEAADDSRWN